MPFNKEETSFFIKLETKGLDKDEREELYDQVGDFVVTEMLESLSRGVSPLSGVGKFKQLSKKYAEDQKGGDRTPNLELDSDMLSALEYKPGRGGIWVGIFDEDEAIKSYGHNTGMRGHPILKGKGVKRPFIPRKGESLKKDITDYIDDIVEDFLNDKSKN